MVHTIQGIPIGLSSDEKLLIVYSQASEATAQVQGWDIENQMVVDVNELTEDMLPEHHRFFFKRFDITTTAPATIVFEGTLRSSSGKAITISKEPRFNDSLSVGTAIYTLSSSPMIAYKSSMEYDADDYGRVTILDTITGKELFGQSLLWSAPIMLNHVYGSSQLTLVAADGVYLVNSDTGEANTIIKGKPFNRHYNWHGNPRIIDAVANAANLHEIAILEQDAWYIMNQGTNGKWTKANEHKLIESAHRISFFDNSVILQSDSSIRVLKVKGELQCEILLSA